LKPTIHGKQPLASVVSSSAAKDSEGLLRIAYSALESISDYQGAVEVADQLVKAYPAIGGLRYWRAMAYDHLDDFSHALTDYLNTIQLADDPVPLAAAIAQNYFKTEGLDVDSCELAACFINHCRRG
jgi:tetratricopeptide (TPR) repeat protein